MIFKTTSLIHLIPLKYFEKLLRIDRYVAFLYYEEGIHYCDQRSEFE